MSFLAKIWSMLFGGGTIVSAVDDAIKLADDVTHEVHDENQRTAGVNAQRVSDLVANQEQATNAAIIEEHNAALDHDALVDKLRDQTGARP